MKFRMFWLEWDGKLYDKWCELLETNKFTVSRISKSSTSKWKYNYMLCLYHPFNTKYKKVYVACKAVIWRHREKELVLEDCVISRMEQ